MLRAMIRIFILIVGILWASLLLISWGSAEDTAQITTSDVITEHPGY